MTFAGTYVTGFPAASVEEGAVRLAVACTPSRINVAATDDDPPRAGPRSRAPRSTAPATAMRMTVATATIDTRFDRPTDRGAGALLGALARGSFAGGRVGPANASRRSCANSRQDA